MDAFAIWPKFLGLGATTSHTLLVIAQCSALATSSSPQMRECVAISITYSSYLLPAFVVCARSSLQGAQGASHCQEDDSSQCAGPTQGVSLEGAAGFAALLWAMGCLC